jgi:hypothetical protein
MSYVASFHLIVSQTLSTAGLESGERRWLLSPHNVLAAALR